MSSPSERVLFVDLARSGAVLFMILGHTLHALLDPTYQQGPLFNSLLYLRGLTSCAFLTLSGFSFILATNGRWNEYRACTPRLGRRLLRFGMFLLIGYALHIPIRPLSDIGRATAGQWQAFAAVDVLQLLAVTLTGLQLLAWLVGSRRGLASSVMSAGALIVLLTPFVWRVNWEEHLPLFLASYLSSATGSQFPLFPWAAYVLFGTGLGMWYASQAARGTSDGAVRAFLMVGVGMVALAMLSERASIGLYGQNDFWRTSPNLFLTKAGSVLIALSAVAWLSQRSAGLRPAVAVLSRNSLTVYVAHLCILYGSIWNSGLDRVVGPCLGPFAVTAWFVAIAGSMSLVAWLWWECERRLGHRSTLIRAAVAAALVCGVA